MMFADEVDMFSFHEDSLTKKKIYKYFAPEWEPYVVNPVVGRWIFVSVKTGQKYLPAQFVSDSPMFRYWHAQYTEMVQSTEVYEVTATFVIYWIKMCLMYEAMEYRELARLQFLKDNVGVKNVFPKSEAVYQKAYGEYFKKFHDF